MALRSLTDVFVLMRNNALYSNNIYAEARNTDRDSLLHGRSRTSDDEMSLAPPIWIDKFEAGQFILSKIDPKMEELEVLHKRHLVRPMLSEDDSEEKEIEEMSQEVTRLISQAHKQIDQLRSYGGSSVGKEKRLLDNVVISLLKCLQTVTAKYRNAQNAYMQQLRSREKTSSDFFDDLAIQPDPLSPSSSNIPVKSFDNFLQQPNYYDDTNDQNVDEFFEIPISNKLTQKQLVLLEQDNTELIETREKEVLNVMKSIVHLNEIYKELAQMVQEQGTILDRIDYNVETTQVKVHHGYEQLKKAEFYQRKSRKLFCISILACVTLVMLILLLITKL
ncbi:syntaxin-16 [Culicoides brevitarsis]|uniref:syntaxin-16 n=1 Tax=Culicoides brevitarsis TaxID=469753 RepID=UPI00307C9038